MIDTLQIILRRLFQKSFEESLNPDEDAAEKVLNVRFEPPDNVEFPAGTANPYLYVFLADIRENRTLRRNERVTIGSGVNQVTVQSPAQLDCHFLATGRINEDHDPASRTLQEHEVLFEAAAALLRHNPIQVRQVLGFPDSFPDPTLATDEDWDALTLPKLEAKDVQLLRDDAYLVSRSLPVDALPPEGYPKISEFWGLMGPEARWRPAAYFIVTVPVERIRRPRGPEVRSIHTTLINKSARQTAPDEPETRLIDRERFYAIGGVITRDSKPVRDIPVTLIGSGKRTGRAPGGPVNVVVTQTTITDGDGRYRFELAIDELGPNYTDWTWSIQVNGKNHPLPNPFAAHNPTSFDFELQ